MTGFGRGEGSSGSLVANVELSSVNRKQAEVFVNLPRDLQEHELVLKKMVLAQISRGRVNASFTISNTDKNACGSVIDLEKARALEEQFARLSQELGRDLMPSPTDFLRSPEVFVQAEVPVEAALPALQSALEAALPALLAMREREGADLKADSVARLAVLESLLDQIKERSPKVLADYRKSLLQRLAEADLLESQENLAEDERLIKEVALYADRCDISEEVTRFRSHLDKFNEYLSSDKPVGRSLDFLCQELNRELNTIGSKANDAELAHLVVTGKTEVEKIREQIQNVE